MTRAIIIGSGLAGLAAAIRLARQGIETEVFESSGVPGGKIAEKCFNGFRFDAGPSLLTLPELVQELLDHDLKIEVRKLEIITRYFFPDGTRLTAWNDVQKLSEEVEQQLEGSAGKVRRYLEKSAEVYELTAGLFIFGSFHRLRNLLNRKALKTLLNFRKLHPFISLHEFNQRELQNDKLVQLFDRYATYNGSNPYKTPATLSVISHLEHNLGAFIPEKGMFQVTNALYRQALRLGVKFHFNQPVQKVETEPDNVSGIWTDTGFHAAEIVVSDVDIYRFYSSILPDPARLKKIEKEERSSSALIFYWGINAVFPELDVHNIFFGADYRKEFSDLFAGKTVSEDPTIYIYSSSKYNPGDAPDGCENWFVMINAPTDVGQNWDKLIAQTRQTVLRKLERMLGKKLEEKIVCEEILSPPEIDKQTGSVGGSLYGSSSNSRYASFNRHANFRSDIRGLYFVGGSVHPGGGIPLCLSSARIVEGLVKEQFLNARK